MSLPRDFPALQRSRRSMLRKTACGFGSLALAGLCSDETRAATANPLAQQVSHVPQRAKRVIFIFMQGGPSHVDTFDRKLLLDRDDGKEIRFRVARTRQVTPERLYASPWKFKRHGQCGQWVSELFPHIAKHVDDLCFIKSMHTEGVAHGPATLCLHTGATNLIRPSVGAWVSYGLGTENRNLPAFVAIAPSNGNGGPRNFGNAFLPTLHQGTALGRAEMPMADLGIQHITNDSVDLQTQRRQMDYLQAINRRQLAARPGDDELEAVISSYELAWRMQTNAPGVMDMAEETPQTLEMYGINEKGTDDFGRQCLMARRLAEAGVRYIQVNYADNGNNPRWDQHNNLPQHEVHAQRTDKPVAGLLADLKQRGLLEDTLIWWGGEFGRTPFAQNRNGRDHNPDGFTVFLAGAGTKPGFSYGETDDYGQNAIVDKVHMHDLHATVLHALGLDHERLTYRYAGRDFRLTDVAGRVVHEIFA